MGMGAGRFLPAAVFAAVCLCAHASDPAGTPKYQSKCLTPQHQRELNRAIHDLALKVTQTRDTGQRSRYQEELCKKLIQTEDYDNALKAARAVADTPGIEQERRAVHHFLVAQIYALKMEASPTQALMEQNRREALSAVADVLARRYPEKWMIGDAARQLRSELQDPMHLAEVRAWVRKRETGGAGSSKAASSRSVSRGLPPNGSGISSGVSTPATDALGGVVDIRRDDFVRQPKAAPLSSETTAQPIPGDVTQRIERAIRSAGALQEPIVIDGMGRRPAPSQPSGGASQ
jgi:hypothetical protein